MNEEFKRLVTEYTDYVYRICFRLLGEKQDAEDATQDTFFKVYKHHRELKKGQNEKNWICTIALNTARDIYRHRKRTKTIFLQDDPSDRGNYSNELYNRLFTEQILGSLDIRDKTVLVLFYIEQKSIEEMAEILTVSKIRVKVWLHRARKRVLKRFEKI